MARACHRRRGDAAWLAPHRGLARCASRGRITNLPLEFLHSGRAKVGQTIGLCRLSLSPRLTPAMFLSLSHRMMVGDRGVPLEDRVRVIRHDHARV